MKFLALVSNKRGAGLKKLVLVPKSADWHLDLRNAKLRIVHPNGTRTERGCASRASIGELDVACVAPAKP